MRATVEIERIVPRGLGLARIDGRVVFVPLVSTGDTCTIEAEESGSKAHLISVDVPGPDRVEPLCQHYGVCGGCDFMHLTYAAQLAAKQSIIVDAMRRTGGFREFAEPEIVGSPEPFHSRSRATWRQAPYGGAGYLKRDSHEAVDIIECPIIVPALEKFRRMVAPESDVQALSNGLDIAWHDDETASGEIRIKVGELTFAARADVFWQANSALIEQFSAHVVAAAEVQSTDRVYDLFSGLGLFALPMAKQAETVDAIDGFEAAVLLGIENARLNGITNCAFQAMSVETWLSNAPKADVVVVDPPRAGLTKSVIDRLRIKVLRRLVYVSCDPVTFARDARKLVDSGFKLQAVTAFDMFPQTHHVELVGVFNR